jgi:L-ribulose-5-phosphate 4-epimerase
MGTYHDLQEECLEANRLLPQFGLVDLAFGNVSVADSARGVFAIKPSGVDYGSLKTADIVICELFGKEVVEGKFRPSSDTPTHRKLLQSFQGIRSVVHTHSRNAVAFAQTGREIPCLGTTHADYFHGSVPVTRFLTPEEISGAYEWETGKVIVERFQNLDPLEVPAVLVRGHGPFAWGESGAKAVENALALEIVADMALKSWSIDASAAPLPPELLNKHFFRKHGPGAYYGQKAAESF